MASLNMSAQKTRTIWFGEKKPTLHMCHVRSFLYSQY
jgi:hypothetical protein